MAFFLVHLLFVNFYVSFFTLLFLFPSLEFWLDLVISRYSYSSSLLFVKLEFVLCFLDGVSGV